MKVVAFLPAKGNSERVENKNTKLLDGKPLFLHTLEKLVSCEFIDEVYLDSESDAIFDIASESGARFLRRDVSLATNKTNGNQLFFNEAKKVEADIYIQVLGTSPFILPETIKNAVNILLENPEYDSVVLVKKEKIYQWEQGKPLYDLENIPNSVDLPETVIETMGLYVTRREVALSLRRRIGNSPYLLAASSLEAVDVNYPDEFELAGYIAAGMREKERVIFRNLKHRLSSSMMSDILDEFGIDGVVTGLKTNLEGAKILGRAKTLKLRKLNPGEDLNGIYNALKTYETMVPNDVIVVENETPDFAYFGELNANLAIRSGVGGVIIDGKTRDISSVSNLGLPVFSRGYNCRDVKGRATVESFNKMIKLGNVVVNPGDLIFGDSDGVIVVPKKYEKKVLAKCLETIKKELGILDAIMLGKESSNILNEFGAF